nr:hypothetical protein [Pandoravirus aubagnensis]
MISNALDAIMTFWTPGGRTLVDALSVCWTRSQTLASYKTSSVSFFFCHLLYFSRAPFQKKKDTFLSICGDPRMTFFGTPRAYETQKTTPLFCGSVFPRVLAGGQAHEGVGCRRL